MSKSHARNLARQLDLRVSAFLPIDDLEAYCEAHDLMICLNNDTGAWEVVRDGRVLARI